MIIYYDYVIIDYDYVLIDYDYVLDHEQNDIVFNYSPIVLK